MKNLSLQFLIFTTNAKKLSFQKDLSFSRTVNVLRMYTHAPFRYENFCILELLDSFTMRNFQQCQA